MRKQGRYRTVSMLAAAALVTLLASRALAASETPVATTAMDEGEPAASDTGRAWTVTTKNGYWALADTGAGPFQVNSATSWGSAGGIDGDTLIYQKVSRTGSDLALYDLAAATPLGPAPRVNTKYWEWDASISGDWVLFGRNNINFGAPKEWQRVMLVNTVTGEKRTLAQTGPAAYLAAGQVTGNYATWERWTRAGGFSAFRYAIAADQLLRIPDAARRDPYAPAVTGDGTLYYMMSGEGCGRNPQLLRRLPDGTTDVIYDFPQNTDAWETFVYTDGTSEDDLYYSRIDCGSRGWRGDIYYMDAVDAATPVPASPIASAPILPGPNLRQEEAEPFRPRPARPEERLGALPAGPAEAPER